MYDAYRNAIEKAKEEGRGSLHPIEFWIARRAARNVAWAVAEWYRREFMVTNLPDSLYTLLCEHAPD